MMMMVSPWVILGSVPRVCDDDDDDNERLSLALAAPPRISIVSVPRRVAPDPTTGTNFPAFRAADPSAGLLLLVSSLGSLAAAGRAMGYVEPDVMLPAYFVCDLASAIASRLPDPPFTVSYHRNLAITAIPGGHYMAAQLCTVDAAADRADLLCFWSDTADWVQKKTLPILRHRDHPIPPEFDPADGAITHDASLWWVDLSGGLLTCDPFADRPTLRFVPLPPGTCLLPPNGIHKYRCVKFSAGKLRFVDIDRHAAKVTMWTLLPKPTNHHDHDDHEWLLEHQLSFQHLRAHDSYRAAGLKEDWDPVLAFVHPSNPDVVYFFLDDYLVGVHMRTTRVLDCALCHLVLPPMKFVSSGFVIACELPPSIATAPALSTNGLPGKDTDTTVAEESTSGPKCRGPEACGDPFHQITLSSLSDLSACNLT